MDDEIRELQPLEVQVGDPVVLYNNGTLVDGLVTGWMVAGGEVVHLFIENIEQAFKLIGDNPWVVLREDEANG